MPYAIEGRVNGIWCREHVGAVDESTLFASREEAEAAMIELAADLGADGSDLRVVELSEVAS